ncbi:MAG TPA: tryptophan--tRNA ligase [Blastocatellia bacterium]|jgi:tryptophanyl-tRNA synthetase|nr:tryptophan--tRNA ligase [Blastocatellia bacterium]HAF22196.1 tryptophan--tRNA ligase [Blastocatellia bacterium]HCX32051.1 tryptophan--tRNA ligase [Blastocatellia bacterium]
MKRIFSGAQPTGNVHLGNYLGALRNWVSLQHEYESFFCIVNLHAITTRQDPALLAQKTKELAQIYLAVGIDPELSTIFIQSDVAEHAELTWILNCVARMSELERMTQFKDKAKKQRENVGVGMFDYPVLMAADILLYQTDLVPVGEDQKQHLELTRDLAIRFNRDYGDTFRIPEPYIPKVGARIMSLSDPAKKMSKSDDDPNGCVMLLDDADSIQRKFKRAVTDSGTTIRFDESRPAIANLLTIFQLLTGKSPEQIEDHFAAKGYAQLKQELADVTVEFLKPFQERVRATTDEELSRLLEKGRDKARQIARVTLETAMARMGISGARELAGLAARI